MFRNYLKLKESFNTKPRTTGAFYPPQIASLYNFPTGYDGLGIRIAIIELGGGYNLSDITTYLTSLGITKTPNITSVSVDGGTNNPSDTSGANYEVVLDIEVIVSIVPGATIRVYFAPNSDQGFYDAINQAITDNCNVISISWGGPESSWSSNQLTAYNALFQTASNNGISVFCAAGDNGSSDGGFGKNVDFPSSSPYVIACGGTTLVASGNTITSETVWNVNSSSSATGGGVSTVFAKPTYQNNVSLMNQYTKRGLPDVSGNADPNTGYLIYINGQTAQIGGTSAVAPLWAALCAIMNQKNGTSLGFLQPKLYSSTSGTLRDITVGNNGAFTAQVGYDLCTGLGSPCANLFTYLSTNVNSFAPIASFTSSVTTGTIPLTVQFTDTSINSPTSWSWNFGDGGTSTARNPSYVFRTAGTFTVTLAATNTVGSNTSQQTVTAQSRVTFPPVSNFNGLSVNFRDFSTNNPTSWNWNFGDGTSSSLQNPTHVYSRAGTYTIQLTARNSAGTSLSRQTLTLH
jgi:subtilase family serine protease